MTTKAPADWDADGTALWELLAPFGQEHLLKFWAELSAEDKAILKSDITALDLTQVTRWFARTMDSPVGINGALRPVPDEKVADSTLLNPTEEMLRWEKLGLEQIADGKFAVLLMAGGQGTRLGSTNPKGMFPLELPTCKSLYELQAKRILRLQALALKQTGKAGIITWYIMTSSGTEPGTRKFFEEHNYWGIKPEDVVMFKQNEIPAYMDNGKMLLDRKNRIARSPDGNGGLYSSMVKNNVLEHMDSRGVAYIHIYGVDNVLVKVGDPRFLGACIEKKVDVGAKCVVKQDPDEKVGLVCVVGSQYEVMEYTELTPEARTDRRPDGGLAFNAGSICNHLYTMDFMKIACSKEDTLKHHVARKKLPFMDDSGASVTPDEPNGVKLEKFVFDVFRLASSLAVVQVAREHEFSPLKNASAAGKDCVETCRSSVYHLHRQYLREAGVKFVDAEDKPIADADLTDEHVCEIAPWISFAGEGLEEYAASNPTAKFPINLV
jgi:UDP-N-acetylglucosamine/UDP-N-acetylgalactosamine diphosphorylase